jgi:hypothetical protein
LAVGPEVVAAVGVGVAGGHVVRRVDGHPPVVHLRAVLHLQRVVTVLAARVDDGTAVGRAGRVVVVVVHVVERRIAAVSMILRRPAAVEVAAVHARRRRRRVLLQRRQSRVELGVRSLLKGIGLERVGVIPDLEPT